MTGASRGIGRAIAVELAEAGANLSLVARTQDALEETAAKIASRRRQALSVTADVTDPVAVRGAIERTVETFGTVDILVNNAGAAPFQASVVDSRTEGFEKYLRVNFLSALYAMQAAGPVLLGKGSGCVLNIASVHGLSSAPGVSYYGAAKAALINLTKTTAIEWAPRGVRVNALAPGWIETEMTAELRREARTREQIMRGVPMQRFGAPDEVSAAAVFLCTEAASYVTGAVLVVDGGWLAGAPGSSSPA